MYFYCNFHPKGAGRPADVKISKSAPQSLNNPNFSDIELISTKSSFMESLLNYVAFESKIKW